MQRIRSTTKELEQRARVGQQLCPRCRKKRREASYTPGNWGRHGTWCRACTKEYGAARYAANSEHIIEHQRLRRRARGVQPRTKMSPEEKYRRNWCRNLWRNYGLTVKEYAWKLHDQGFACALCSDERVHVDHDHTSGKFRGLLCQQHNTGIGKLGDDIDGLRSTLAYLERHSTL